MTIAAIGATALALAASPGTAAARPSPAVFVQNDNPSGNVVFVYDRASDGTLTLAGRYATGGFGGVLAGSVVDHLASQGSLTLDTRHGLLFAVNAGSDTVSVFWVRGDQLTLRQTLRSGGSFPVSVTVSGNTAYVLNAREGGAVSGFHIDHQRVEPIVRSTRALGLDPTATPEFTHTPGQVTFTPDGHHLLVTTKANGNEVIVFGVGTDGRLSAPAVNALPGTVPFAATFDPFGHLLLTEAGTNAVVTFAVRRSGVLSQLDSLPTTQAATCWIVEANGFGYASNAGSGTVTGVSSASNGALALVGQTSTDAGTVDAAASSDGQFLYVQTGAAGIIDEYRTNSNGSLARIGAITVPHAAGAEGIAAS
jgi:6-phosphogluconolactonase (cycloisomerase 2 family)